jgi:hypothetical protein
MVPIVMGLQHVKVISKAVHVFRHHLLLDSVAKRNLVSAMDVMVLIAVVMALQHVKTHFKVANAYLHPPPLASAELHNRAKMEDALDRSLMDMQHVREISQDVNVSLLLARPAFVRI